MHVRLVEFTDSDQIVKLGRLYVEEVAEALPHIEFSEEKIRQTVIAEMPKIPPTSPSPAVTPPTSAMFLIRCQLPSRRLALPVPRERRVGGQGCSRTKCASLRSPHHLVYRRFASRPSSCVVRGIIAAAIGRRILHMSALLQFSNG